MTPRWPASPTSPRSTLLDLPASSNGKHVLVEKPLWATHDERHRRARSAGARGKACVCYTAYNHRFEPHYVRMRDLIAIGRARRDLSLPHVLRQRHGAAGARLRPGATRARACCPISARICSTPAASGSAISSDEFRCVGVHAASRTARPTMSSIASRERTTAARAGDDAARCGATISPATSSPSSGSAHIQSLCKWGAVAVHRRTRRAAERPSAGGDRDAWCRTIRPGRSNTRTSRRCASSGATDRPRERHLAPSRAGSV